jgi:hypothetical protein
MKWLEDTTTLARLMPFMKMGVHPIALMKAAGEPDRRWGRLRPRWPFGIRALSESRPRSVAGPADESSWYRYGGGPR